MKIIILLLYFERPNMVRNALNSIKNLDYEDWHLAFIDDGSQKPGEPIVREILADYQDQISYYNTHHSIDDKNRQGGSMVGCLMNQILKQTDAEIAIMLCDDDALISSYFKNLKEWALKNPEQYYCYSHVILFDPAIEKPSEALPQYLVRQVSGRTMRFNRRRNWYNKTQQLYPEAKLDASQVAWRTNCNKKVSFPGKRTCHLDSAFYEQLGKHFGQVRYSGFFGQYKAMHDDTLSIREEATRNNSKINKLYRVKDLDRC